MCHSSSRKSRVLLFAIFAVVALFSFPAVSAAGVFEEQVLAKNGEGEFPYYRIVGLANIGEGVILASYDGRPDGSDSPSPNSILQRRSADNGETWGNPTYIAKGQEGNDKYGFSDPSYVFDRNTGKVFNFHVFSKDTGFRESVIGNDDADRNVLSAEVAISVDKGASWSTDPNNQPYLPPIPSQNEATPPLITRTVKPVGTTVNGHEHVGGVVGMFATSGQGIQLRYGKYADRLIQQFVGLIIQDDGSKQSQAYSVFSDDGGDTWQMGKPVGTGMDENKVVELSNGDIMLNSRPQAAGYRKVAISKDGGETYSEPNEERQLPDPANNGHITRMYPDAPQDSDDSKILLFTNTATQESRTNAKIRYSCDDGKNWSSGKPIRESQEGVGYTVVTPLVNDTFGIFFEDNSDQLVFYKVDKEWIGVDC